ncbi:MAG: transglycosylase domain-containing protein [Chloroflexi bacterium]|nr:transglycosylase domain-containing protein [Chloroflexota bacterium]
MSDNPNELPINSQSDLPEINTGTSGNGDSETVPGSGDTTGWRLIARDATQQGWYKPANAFSTDELNARTPAAVTPELLPGSVPLREGGWYSPANTVGLPTISASASVALNLDSLPPAEPVALPVIEPATELTDVSEPPPAPIAEGTTFEPVDAPIGLESAEGFRDTPEVPLSIALESESSGLRDVERAAEESSQPIEGLTLEEAAALQQQGTGGILAVERGLGGVSDTNPLEAIAANPQSTPLSTASATHVLGDTGEMQKKPTPQSSGFQAQEPPQVMGTGSSQPITPQPTARDIAAARFREVEQSVQILRDQFKQGQITRNQLETELRRLMVLDDQGRWWTLGVDSNRWYRFDGREWIPDTPPQTGSQPVVSAAQGVRGNYLPTETNVQAPIAAAAVGAYGLVQPSSQEPTTPKIALDEYGMPLPQRVPEDDPNATMVNIQAFTPRADEPTWGDFQQPKPAPDAPAASSGLTDKTIQSAGAVGEPVVAPTIVSPAQAAQAAMGATIEAPRPGGDASANIQVAAPPKQVGIQPDYSAAYENPLDRSNIIKYGLWVGIAGIVASLGVTLCLLLGMVGYYMSVVSKYQDKIDNLGQQASTFETTRIYDAQGNVLAEYNDPREGARTKVPLEKISPWVIHATVATEDETYYDNPGFSVFSILRAVYTNVRGEGPRSGASTITQQLVRQLILEEDFATQVSSQRKITEIILAAELSRKYNKNEILQLYLNEIYYGNLAYGIEAASQAYFDKPASDLNIAEAALLAGLPQAPATYSPISNREAAIGRMSEVLRLMTEANGNGCIQLENTFDGFSNGTTFPFDLSQPLCVTPEFLNADPNFAIDLATVQVKTFEQPARDLRYAHFVNWIWDQLTETYGSDTIYATGFNVYTTLDPTIQNTAQQAVNDELPGSNFNNGSVVVMDPQTGAVWAMVGSADFNNAEIDGQVNVAFTPQQPGSSIKPVVYVTAFEGIDATSQCYDAAHPYFTPSTVLWDTPTVWGNPPSVYEPVNYDRTFRGPVTIRRALSNSLNLPAVKTLDCIGTERFTQKAEQMGITFPLQSPTAVGLPAALGATEVRLFDMVAAYAAFGNGGIRREPFGISRIETTTGDVIFQVDISSLQGIPVIRPEHAYLISSILSDNQARSEEFGSGSSSPLEVQGYTVAVKTGTTNDNRDAWTIGWTPQVIVGVWMGNTDNSSTGNQTGYGVAAPVWNATISAALQGKPNVGFPQPAGIIQAQVCNDTGTTVPANGCGPGGNYNELFWNSQPPTEGTDSLFQVINVDPFTNRIANQYCQQYAKPQNYLMTGDATAISWINNRPEGQAWAQSRGLTLPLQTPPVEECTADQPQPVVALNSPAPGATVTGPVQLLGQVSLPNFQKYEFQIAPAGTESFTTIAGQIYSIQEPTANSFLGGWNSIDTPDGQYVLRLVAYATNNAFLDVRVPITVLNNQQAPVVPATTPTQ